MHPLSIRTRRLALDRQREGDELQRLYDAVLAGMSEEIETHAGRQEDQAARYAANAYALRALIDVRRGRRQPTPRQHELHEAFRRHLCCAATKSLARRAFSNGRGRWRANVVDRLT